jgi:hypothetical protein
VVATSDETRGGMQRHLPGRLRYWLLAVMLSLRAVSAAEMPALASSEGTNPFWMIRVS